MLTMLSSTVIWLYIYIYIGEFIVLLATWIGLVEEKSLLRLNHPAESTLGYITGKLTNYASLPEILVESK